MTVWEYRVVVSAVGDSEKTILKELGADGWELVAVHVGIPEGSLNQKAALYLKRAK